MSQSTAVPVTVTFVQRNAVHELRPCLHFLSATDADLVRVQFALGGRAIPSIATVAGQLHETPSVEYAAVVFSLRKMEASAHRGQCRLLAALPASDNAVAVRPRSSARTAPPTRQNVVAAKAVTVAPTAVAPPHASSSRHGLEIAGAIVIVLALAAGLAFGVRRRSGLGGFARRHVQTPRPGPRLRRDIPMRTTPRRRRYVSRASLTLLRPVFRTSLARDAYVLRVVGEYVGPVLREDRRRQRLPYQGPERRGAFGGVGQPTT